VDVVVFDHVEHPTAD
jgi:hypothetical protein